MVPDILTTLNKLTYILNVNRFINLFRNDSQAVVPFYNDAFFGANGPAAFFNGAVGVIDDDQCIA